MKKYFLNLSAILLALSFSAFIKPIVPTFATHVFKFKATADARVQGQVANNVNWEEGTLTCDAINDLPCNLIVDEQYSHPINLGGGVTIEVLNTTSDNPQNESIPTITTTKGYLDIAPNPDEQYYIVGGYSYTNQSF